MRKIFVVLDCYLPGFKFGGPVRTVANMVDRLSKHYEFSIFTSDRDLGDLKPYANVQQEQWTRMGNARVLYTSDWSVRHVLRRVREIAPDIVYLNSFFSRATVKVLLAKKIGCFPDIPILLAPRGEFAAGALIIKPRRKKFYIGCANALGLLDDIAVQASTEYERKDISLHLRHGQALLGAIVAPDLAGYEGVDVSPRTSKQAGTLRLIFLSRISPNKNLDGAIRMLERLSGEVTFSVYGPIGDPEYWEHCRRSISCLPSNIKVEYHGSLKHEEVAEVLAQHDLLLLPTRGENYGHVISESLIAGCPVLISDQTPWRGLEEKGVGADFSLDRPERFHAMLNKFLHMDDSAYLAWSGRAREYGIACAQDDTVLEQNLRMFSWLISDNFVDKEVTSK